MKSTKTASLPHRDAWFFLAAFLVAPLLILALCLGSWIPALAAALCSLGAFLLWFFCYRGRAGTPDSLMYAFIFLLVRLWLGGRQRSPRWRTRAGPATWSTSTTVPGRC